MLTFLQALPIGNAVRIGVSPDPDATYFRVLRRTDANFAGASDPAAVIVADMQAGPVVLDVDCVNGTEYFYADFSLVGAAWVAGSVGSATPASSYSPAGVDPQKFVLERVQLGLNAEIAAGRLTPPTGAIKVWSAPAVTADQLSYPVFSVHLDNYDSTNRFIGDVLESPYQDSTGNWDSTVGWLSQYSLGVVGVSQNPDERIALRMAVQRIILGNMGLFAAAGMSQINFSQRDSEMQGAEPQSASLYLTNGSFSCLAPTVITNSSSPVSVTVEGVSTDSP